MSDITSTQLKSHIRTLRVLETSMIKSIEAVKENLPNFDDTIGEEFLKSVQESKAYYLLSLVFLTYKPWFWESKMIDTIDKALRLDELRKITFSTRDLMIKTAQLRVSRL